MTENWKLCLRRLYGEMTERCNNLLDVVKSVFMVVYVALCFLLSIVSVYFLENQRTKLATFWSNESEPFFEQTLPQFQRLNPLKRPTRPQRPWTKTLRLNESVTVGRKSVCLPKLVRILK